MALVGHDFRMGLCQTAAQMDTLFGHHTGCTRSPNAGNATAV